MTQTYRNNKDDYPLGQTEAEYQRLMVQARFLRPYTEKYLRAAGIGQAMSVLDIGAGVGDVSLLAGELVGSGGNVLGIDFDEQALAAATSRAESLRCSDWVQFETARLDDFSTQHQYDALIGRLVLLYLPDAAATLRHLLRFVRPGGVVVFHEIDFTGENPSSPECALFDEAYALLREVFRRSGVPRDFGRRIGRTFVDAGLPFPTLCADVTAGGGKGSFLYPWLAQTLASLEPRLEALGIPRPGFALDAELSRTLESAVLEKNSQLMGPTLVGAWTRRPM